MSLRNETDPRVREVLAQWTTAVPAFAELFRRLRQAEVGFSIAATRAGLEVGAESDLAGGRPNRSRMRIVPCGERQVAVLFFKTGAGGARYGYGGLAVRIDRLRSERVAEWVAFLASGCDCSQTPRGLRRSFAFPIPD